MTNKSVSLLPIYIIYWCIFLQNTVLGEDTCNEGCTGDASSYTGRIPSVTLSNGVEMPQLSLGAAHLMTHKNMVESNPEFTGFVPEDGYRSVQLGLEAGMRGIETGLIYRSHGAIRHVLGNWLAAGKLKRSDIFLTTKIFHGSSPFATSSTIMPELDSMSPEEVEQMTIQHFEQSLHELGVGYVDLMLLHWPACSKANSSEAENRARRITAWKVLENFYQRGWARAIGVSNFNEHHLKQLIEDGAEVKPMVNQIEASIYQQFDSIVNYCNQHNIVLQAYSPLGRQLTNVLNDPVVLEMAQKYQKNAGQIALRYLIQKNYTLTCLSTSEERLRTNQDIFYFEIDEQDMAKLNELNRLDGTWGLPNPYNLA